MDPRRNIRARKRRRQSQKRYESRIIRLNARAVRLLELSRKRLIEVKKKTIDIARAYGFSGSKEAMKARANLLMRDHKEALWKPVEADVLAYGQLLRQSAHAAIGAGEAISKLGPPLEALAADMRRLEEPKRLTFRRKG